MMDIDAVLAKEREDLAGTDLCQQAKRFVGVRGSSDPSFVFVGEAPGKQEDEQGEPFVGRAGSLLDEWMDGLGIEDGMYAITNVVKCRPPGNRTPTAEEIERFGSWLADEMDALDPSVIFTLGTTATEALVPEAASCAFLDEACYRRWESTYGVVVPLPHPAYGLRQGGMDLPYETINDAVEGGSGS